MSERDPMNADKFKRLHIEPLADLAREHGLYFAVVIVEPDWKRGRIKSRAARVEAGPDIEGSEMLKDVVYDDLLNLLRN